MTVLNLFKYYAPKYDGEDNLSFHTEGSLYFQAPENFNDPWDCKAPEIKCSSDEQELNKILSKLTERGRLSADVKQRIKGMSPMETSQWLVENFKTSYDMLRSIMGVLSLSFIPDSELMWSHYASSHFGYMLHVQIDLDTFYTDSSLENLVDPFPVIYTDERKVWNLDNYDDDRKKYAYDLISIKSKAWEYECEFRLLNVDMYGFIKMPSNWLKSIVIGINTKDELSGKLIDIGKSLNIPVLSAKMNEKKYKIDIPDLGITGNDGKKCYEEVIKLEIFQLQRRQSTE